MRAFVIRPLTGCVPTVAGVSRQVVRSAGDELITRLQDALATRKAGRRAPAGTPDPRTVHDARENRSRGSSDQAAHASRSRVRFSCGQASEGGL
jgi:hypothetical protein